MAGLFSDTDYVIHQFLGFERKKLDNKETSIPLVSDKECFKFINEMYNTMEINYSSIGSKPKSISRKLWNCRYASCIGECNSSPEKILEKAVAMLAEKGHMPGWFNQCPVASGITGPHADPKRAVDLVFWSKSNKKSRLIELKFGRNKPELKFGSNTPPYALFEVLDYGLAYIFCRAHQKELHPHETLMNALHVSLEVVAPKPFYIEYFKGHRYHNLQNIFEQMSKSLDKFAGSKIHGLSMSLDALAFPADFQMPFGNGKQVKDRCDTHRLTAEGRKIRDAFNKLTPVWPAP